MNTDANIGKKILEIWIQQYIKKIKHHDQVGFFPGMQGWYNTHQSLNMTHHTNKMKDTHYAIISIEKAFDKTQHPLMIKTLSTVGTEGTYLYEIKADMTSPLPASSSTGKTVSVSPKPRTRQGRPLSPPCSTEYCQGWPQ